MYFKELSKRYRHEELSFTNVGIVSIVNPLHNRTIIPAALQGIKTGVKQSKHKNYFIVFFCSSVKGQVMRAFFKRRCTPARLMTNASPMTDVAVVAGRQVGRQRRRLQLVATSRRLHEKPEARNTHSAPIAVHFYVYGKWLLYLLFSLLLLSLQALLTAFGFVLRWLRATAAAHFRF